MPKPEFVRVKHKATRHEYTVAANRVTSDVDVLDKPAVDAVGQPLPPKPHVQIVAPTRRATKKRTRRKSPAPVTPTTEPDAPADETKEG